MDDEYRAALRMLRRWVLGLFAALMVLGGIANMVSAAWELAWFPWQIKMQTRMIRASNSYVTTQQAALRQFLSSYEDAVTDGQKAAIVRQMREIADLIPGDVQPDIRNFLAGN